MANTLFIQSPALPKTVVWLSSPPDCFPTWPDNGNCVRSPTYKLNSKDHCCCYSGSTQRVRRDGCYFLPTAGSGCSRGHSRPGRLKWLASMAGADAFMMALWPFAFLLLLPSFAASASTGPNSAAATNSTSCPKGWSLGPDNLKCFKRFSSSLSWNASESICQSFRAHLASLTSVHDIDFVQSLCQANDGGGNLGCWVGGRGIKSSPWQGFSWRWSDNNTSWNNSAFTGQPFLSNCTSASCPTVNSTESCMVVRDGRLPLRSERCDAAHEQVCMLIPDNTCYHKLCHKEYLVILVVVSGLILSATLALVIWLLIYRRSKKRRRSRKVSSPSAAALVPPPWKVFTGEELRSITKNFSEGNRLPGDAKTGGTYSGILPDGPRVAVKRLKRSNLQRKKEFFSEIGRVAKLHHPNLVAVKGGCYDHGDRYIIYEFVANGPLDRWLHHVPIGGRSLDWKMRMKIATTLAQGIAFLHDKVKPQVVHRDIRASNVLLDEDFGAHLMGVGMSKFVSWEVMHERTVVAATYGYLAPEFMYRNELTTKSDVYSFGVLLLEIISGRRPVLAVESMGWQSIFEWATPLVQSHRYTELLDPIIQDIPEVGVIQKVVDLVYVCTQHVPSVRPRMSHIVHQLQQLGLRTAIEQQRSEATSSATFPMLPLQLETVL